MAKRRPPKHGHSRALYREARRLLPGGVDSPVRSFASVGGEPFFVASGRRAYLRDADGNFLLDYVMSYGPLLFGHARGPVVREVMHAARKGTSFGAPTELEVRLARLVSKAMSHVEMLRFVNSGTEATMSAARLARAATGRKRLVKVDGGYHGHADSFLVSAGSGVATLGIAGSPGVPEELAALTTVIPYNDSGALEEVFRTFPGEVAGFFVEPVAANMGVVPPEPGYLETVRALCTKEGALLVFDEVITGFRLARGGAAEVFGVTPDLVCLGKILGGGLPVGAYGGRRDLMEKMAPSGPVYQAGTLSGNPLAMVAGIAMLAAVEKNPPYKELERKAGILEEALRSAIAEAGCTARVCLNRAGSMATLFFAPGPIRNFAEAKRSDTKAHATFFHAMLDRGVFLAPAQYEAMFVSTAHTDADLRRTGKLAAEALREALG